MDIAASLHGEGQHSPHIEFKVLVRTVKIVGNTVQHYRLTMELKTRSQNPSNQTAVLPTGTATAKLKSSEPCDPYLVLKHGCSSNDIDPNVYLILPYNLRRATPHQNC